MAMDTATIQVQPLVWGQLLELMTIAVPVMDTGRPVMGDPTDRMATMREQVEVLSGQRMRSLLLSSQSVGVVTARLMSPKS